MRRQINNVPRPPPSVAVINSFQFRPQAPQPTTAPGNQIPFSAPRGRPITTPSEIQAPRRGVYQRMPTGGPPQNYVRPTFKQDSLPTNQRPSFEQTNQRPQFEPANQRSSFEAVLTNQQLYRGDDNLLQERSSICSAPPITTHGSIPYAVVSPLPVTQEVSLTSSQPFQRLQVEDALSYLDQVKFTFGSHPQIYNSFLDIMKEFKASSIDTPGVIRRVSNLFHGHPDLVVGFNAFLPPGYRIELKMEQINVRMPGQEFPTVIHTTSSVSPLAQPVPAARPTSFGSPLPPLVSLPNRPVPDAVNTLVASSDEVEAQVVVLPPSNEAELKERKEESTNQTAPVEFNHAINYVNRIKNRFQWQPVVYKQFLEILHVYQKQQRILKEGGAASPGEASLSESEVFEKVAHLFENQEDLLVEFRQFLPEASVGICLNQLPKQLESIPPADPDNQVAEPARADLSSQQLESPSEHQQLNEAPTADHRSSFRDDDFYYPPVRKRSRNSILGLSAKRARTAPTRDVSLAEAGKYGTLNEFAFFDRVRKALRSQGVYDNLLRCILLFNDEVITRTELLHLVTPFLGKIPELFRWFKSFLGYTDRNAAYIESIPSRVINHERVSGDLAMDIDYSTCKRLGASYCALPKSYAQPTCSGRTALCREVLNDVWVSFPSWSEDSTFVTNKKTQFEEIIYRCEDERFELDVVLESNLATIHVLEGVQKKLSKLPPEEAAKFRLDDSLGGSSQVVHMKAIKRIYGDKFMDIVDGLKKNPGIAVPLVLRRLKAKEEEWKDAQANFNKLWREQNEKYYLKSLDHQGINFKQHDTKALRSKALLNEIEAIFDERREQAEEGVPNCMDLAPHLVLSYPDRSIVRDASDLMYHCVKRQTSIQKEDKHKIKHLLKLFIPDMFFHSRQDVSDDEEEDDDDGEGEEQQEETIPSKLRSRNHANGSQQNGNGKTEPTIAATDTLESIATGSQTTDVKVDVDEERSDSTLIEPEGRKLRNKSSLGSEGDSNPVDHSNGHVSRRHLVLSWIGKYILPADKLPPLASGDNAKTVFLCNNNWYLFFRLHHILCERLSRVHEQAAILAAEDARDKRDRRESIANTLKLKTKADINVDQYYPAFLEMVRNVLDGNIDSVSFEDALREMFTINAYIAYTIDKVIQNAVRQIQHLVMDELCLKCADLFVEEQNRLSDGLSQAGQSTRAECDALREVREQQYQKRAEQVLADDNCFKLHIHKSDNRLSIELLDGEAENSDDPGEVEAWSDYIEKYTREGENQLILRDQLARKPVFLARNIRRFRERSKQKFLLSRRNYEQSLLTPPTLVPATSIKLSRQEEPMSRSGSTDEGSKGSDEPIDFDEDFDERVKPQALLVLPTSLQRYKPPGSNNYKREVRKSSDPVKVPLMSMAAPVGTLVVNEGTECRFSLNSFKMVFVVDSESLLYKTKALVRAKQSHRRLSQRLSARFQRWHRKWVQTNASAQQVRQTTDFLMGWTPDQDENDTRRFNKNDTSKPPYYNYNRYRLARFPARSSTVKGDAS